MRKALVISALLLFSVFSFAQTYNRAAAAQLATSPQMGGPVFSAPIISSPGQYGGLALQYGYATTQGWGYPPLLVTPEATFATVSPNPVGATNATSNLQAGASNSTVDSQTVALPAILTEVQVFEPGAVQPEGYVSGSWTPAVSGRRTGGFNLGAAEFDVITARRYGEGPSLGEVAKATREQRRNQAVRVFTNSDVQQLKDRQPGASLGPSRRPVPQNPPLPPDSQTPPSR